MSALPAPQPDPELLRLCVCVAEGQMRVYDGIRLVQEKMRRLIAGSTDVNKISVIAVRQVEALNPGIVGVLLSQEDLETMWEAPQQSTESHPDLHGAFILLSCIQITHTGLPHEGAKAMTQALDQMLPDQPSLPLN